MEDKELWKREVNVRDKKILTVQSTTFDGHTSGKYGSDDILDHTVHGQSLEDWETIILVHIKLNLR